MKPVSGAAGAPGAVVLASGGMDSCVCVALALRDHARPAPPALLHVDYGQRTEARERQAFLALADYYQLERRWIVACPGLAAMGGSALTDPSIAVPRAAPAPGEVPVTYVPFRNAHFLALAVSWAEVLGTKIVVIGAVEPDSSGYPDCRPSYYAAFNRLIAAGTRDGDIVVQTPLIARRKAEIVSLGLELGAPLQLSWSCYQASDRACGECDSCRLRLRAFAEAGVPDPIPYGALR